MKSSTPIAERKKQLRKEVLTTLTLREPQDLIGQSVEISRQVLELECIVNASSVMIYLSFQQEVETDNLFRALIDEGKEVSVPYLNPLTRKIEPYSISDITKETEKSEYGIREPKAKLRKTPYDLSNIDIVIVPGLAFDREGGRLGRGLGCYDQFLKDLPNRSVSIGLAFDFQIVPEIPMSKTDQRVDYVISTK